MTKTRPALAALLLALAPALSAAEERLTPPLVLDGAVGDGVWLYGQLNKGVLVYDDGDETNAYAPVDNNNSSTRAGIWLRTMPAEDFTFSINAEGEWKPYSTGDLSRVDDDVEWDVANLRKLEAIAAFEGYGTLWAGQGSMATDGAAEQDLSGTTLVAYSSVGDSAGGQRFVTNGGAISNVTVGGAFSNYDGLGRLMRLRYDTPTWRGFGLRTSVGRRLAQRKRRGAMGRRGGLRPEGDYAPEAVRIRAAAGYARRADDTNRLSGSVSALHIGDRPQPHARRRRAGARRRRRPLFRLRQAGLDRKDPVHRPDILLHRRLWRRLGLDQRIGERHGRPRRGPAGEEPPDRFLRHPALVRLRRLRGGLRGRNRLPDRRALQLLTGPGRRRHAARSAAACIRKAEISPSRSRAVATTRAAASALLSAAWALACEWPSTSPIARVRLSMLAA
jgi:hypothetical protein